VPGFTRKARPPEEFGFTGNASTGLYDYGARWYDPSLGRFLQPDTLVPDPFSPQDLNRYAYVGNDPINFNDPTGNFAVIAFAMAVMIAIMFAAPAAEGHHVTQAMQDGFDAAKQQAASVVGMIVAFERIMFFERIAQQANEAFRAIQVAAGLGDSFRRLGSSVVSTERVVVQPVADTQMELRNSDIEEGVDSAENARELKRLISRLEKDVGALDELMAGLEEKAEQGPESITDIVLGNIGLAFASILDASIRQNVHMQNTRRRRLGLPEISRNDADQIGRDPRRRRAELDAVDRALQSRLEKMHERLRRDGIR